LTALAELRALAPIDSPDFYAGDPHPALARIRREAPVLRYPHLNTWLVSRYADVKEMSRNPADFSVAAGTHLNDALHGNVTNSFFAADAELISTIDPPRHAELRRVIAPAFAPRAIAALTIDLATYLRAQFDLIEPGTQVEVVEQLALQLPFYAVARILGITGDNVADLRHWSDQMVKMGAALTVEELAEVARGFEPLHDFLFDALERKRAAPGEDLLSVLAHAEMDGSPVSRANVLMLAIATLVAGNETTRALLTWLVWTFATQPEQYRQLRSAPDLAASVVEETLRLSPPVFGFLRTATRDTELHGVPVAAGDHLFMLYLSANRDEEVFSNPGVFDLRRTDESGHLAFGWGQHMCVGAALARLEARIFAAEFAARFAEVHLAAPPARVPSLLQNALAELRVDLVPG
jgi:cytochrome P450